MKLFYQTYPENLAIGELAGQKPMVIIPGLFGSTTNWRSFARQLSATMPVITIDQRNHGRSPQADTNSYADMVEDLEEFCDDHGLAEIQLCGHSMGGKTAMLYTQKNPTQVANLIVLDIAPVRYSHSHAPFLDALIQLDLADLKSRSDADKLLLPAIPDNATRLFLLQSLSGSAGSFHWRLNLPVLLHFQDQISDFPSRSENTATRTLFVSGELSNYLRPKHHPQIQQLFPNTTFAEIMGAGHWLHAEKPQEVLELVSEFINK